MTTETISVPGIHCGHCKSNIEGALAQLAGVSAATVAIEPRTVEVVFDQSTVSFDQIVQTIEDQGYEISA